jgi:hypothetical protein
VFAIVLNSYAVAYSRAMATASLAERSIARETNPEPVRPVRPESRNVRRDGDRNHAALNRLDQTLLLQSDEELGEFRCSWIVQ